MWKVEVVASFGWSVERENGKIARRFVDNVQQHNEEEKVAWRR